MPLVLIDEDLFLRLWECYGRSWTIADYASAMSKELDRTIKPNSLAQFIWRNRAKWTTRGYTVNFRRVQLREEFPWPAEDLDRGEYRKKLWKFLEYCGQVRVFGHEALKDHQYKTWDDLRDELTRTGQLIRLNPKTGKLYIDDARPLEHGRVVETLEVYLWRVRVLRAGR